MDQRLRDRLCLARCRFCAATPTRIQTAGYVLAAHGFYRLHHPANRLGCATRLGHARASAHSRRFGRECRLSAARAAEIFWRAFPVLFAVAFRGAGLGRDRELAASESTIQSAVPVLVWIARVRLLFSSL